MCRPASRPAALSTTRPASSPASRETGPPSPLATMRLHYLRCVAQRPLDGVHIVTCRSCDARRPVPPGDVAAAAPPAKRVRWTFDARATAVVDVVAVRRITDRGTQRCGAALHTFRRRGARCSKQRHERPPLNRLIRPALGFAISTSIGRVERYPMVGGSRLERGLRDRGPRGRRDAGRLARRVARRRAVARTPPQVSSRQPRLASG